MQAFIKNVSVQFSCSVMSKFLQPHEPQHTRPPCPSPTLGVHPNPCPLSQWCHPTISASVVPFSSCPQSFPASGSSQMSQLFASDGQSIEVSASTSVPPMNTQDWSHLGWTGWISLQSKGLSRVISNTTVQKHLYFGTQLSLYNFTKVEEALSQERIFLNLMVVWVERKKVKSLSHFWLCDLWTLACQAPPSMGFCTQEICDELPFPSPGDLPDTEIEPWSSVLQADFTI